MLPEGIAYKTAARDRVVTMLTNEFDQARLQELVSDVMANGAPDGRLNHHLVAFEKSKETAMAMALFESISYRRRIANYWVFAGICRVYEEAQRYDAAFNAANLALQCDPSGPAGPIINGILFRFFARHGRLRDAADVFLSNIEIFPGSIIAPSQQIEVIFAALGIGLAAPAAQGETAARFNYRIVQQSTREAWVCPALFGGALPHSLAHLAKPEARSAIDVALFNDGELLVQDGQVVVLSANGILQRDMSVAPFPDIFLETFKRKETNNEAFELIELDEAVVIQCSLAGHNYGHFLIDQIPRLALFEQAGADINNAVVIGPQIITGFQQKIVDAVKIRTYLGTHRRARIKVKRLWTSTDGANTLPIAHFGEVWGLNFIRKRLGIAPFETVQRASTGTRRLYVSRNDSEGRHIANEAEILPLLQAHGFERVTPEKLPFVEQVALFAQASHVTGPHGAGLSNIIFSPQGLTFMEFFHPLFIPNNFAQLVPAMGVNYAAFVAKDALSDAPAMNDERLAEQLPPDTPFPWRFRDIRVDVGELQRWLATL